MGVSLLQVRIPQASAMPEDDVINTFHFSTPEDELIEAQADELFAAVQNFYKEVGAGGTNSVGSYLQNQLATEDATFRLYDALAAGSTPPYHQAQLSIWEARLSAVDLPSEVAVGLSYHGDLSLPGPQSRRRGRLYIGPLNAGVVTDEVTGVRVSAAFRTDLAAAALKLIADVRAIGGVLADIDWTVFSRGKGTKTNSEGEVVNPDGTEDWAPFTTDVVGGWIDNAFDTQRRRGLASTVRTTFGPV